MGIANNKRIKWKVSRNKESTQKAVSKDEQYGLKIAGRKKEKNKEEDFLQRAKKLDQKK